MDRLKDGAQTGSRKEGNPYEGDVTKGIAYDIYEANFPVIVQEGPFPRLLTTYRQAARELVGYSSASEGQRVLDMGSGTGVSTLELLQQKKKISAVGMEMSEGMLLVARYKFHQNDGKDLLARAGDEKVLRYWEKFREESEGYQDKVEFLQGDFQATDSIPEESVDAAIASQFMHWTDLSRSFQQLNRFLRSNGEVIWSSASHFYNDAQFPAADFSFRYNEFLAHVLEDVCSRGQFTAKDYRSLSTSQHNFESIRVITDREGFDTEQIATHLRHVDLQVLIRNQVPVFVRQLITSEVDPEELEARVREAISRAIVHPEALRDTQHKYDIIPIFRSVKKI